jgi:hypothetical protein
MTSNYFSGNISLKNARIYMKDVIHRFNIWSAEFGDRKNEIVFIGQDMEEATIRAELNACLATDEELAARKWKEGYEDDWPVQRAYALMKN